MRIPNQIKRPREVVRSWSVNHPSFYGVKTTHRFVDSLLAAEQELEGNFNERPHPSLCRVLAAYHGPTGAKVPLCVSTVSGCVRPIFVGLNEWMQPGSMSCYSGGCYLFHARAVPAKKQHEVKVRAHTIPREGLLAAARLSGHFGLPIRDNQTSDGALSMVLPTKDGDSLQLLANLETLNEARGTVAPYLCFSSAYVEVPKKTLQALGQYPNLVVHMTVSGWHSKEENSLRLREFSNYLEELPNVFLRVVNRQDWAGMGDLLNDEAARCEGWLLTEILKRGFVSHVIRTPYHSVHPFPGSRTGSLGSRHMAYTEYSEVWREFFENGAKDCCSTGKCKTCGTRCGAEISPKPRKPLIAARAYQAMLEYELDRQGSEGCSPLSYYTARMLAKKSKEQFEVASDIGSAESVATVHNEWDNKCRALELTPIERRRLSNDSHALVMDGLDRHGLWKNGDKRH